MSNMISMKDFMQCINYRITEGSEYLWKCFGNNVHQIESSSSDFSISILFDTQTQFVYQMEVWDYLKDRTYRWVAPDFIKGLKKAYKDRGLKFKRCLDDRKYIDLDLAADIMEKATAIASGAEYDPRVMIELDMTHDEIYLIMQAAHLEDVSVNQFIANVVERYFANNSTA